MNIQLLNLALLWPRLRPHLSNRKVTTALNMGMKVYVSEFAPTTSWNARKGPWSYSQSIEPVPALRDSLGWYQCWGACHWLAGFNCQLGKLLHPRCNWLIVQGKKHSTAIGFTARRALVFDVLRCDGVEGLNKTLQDCGLTPDLQDAGCDWMNYDYWFDRMHWYYDTFCD